MSSVPLYRARKPTSAMRPEAAWGSAMTDLASTASASSISVVICAYTEARWHDLHLAIESVTDQSHLAKEVVVVIDHCPTLFSRARSAYPDITVVENAGPQGLSGARNEGYQRTSAEVVAFLDDDARADPDWLEYLLGGYVSDTIVGVGGAVVPGWHAPRPRWLPAEFDWVIGCSHSGMPDDVAPVRNLIGANMSFRRTTLEQVGGFSNSLGRYGANSAGCEETELCIRAATILHGALLLYMPGALVTHSVFSGRRTPSYFLRRCYGEGRSKATVESMTGTAALSCERNYLRQTIPHGIGTAVGAALRGDMSALGRALAIVLGVASTLLGYGSARLRKSLRPAPATHR
jgi:GT2 family glycosyltransferase